MEGKIGACVVLCFAMNGAMVSVADGRNSVLVDASSNIAFGDNWRVVADAQMIQTSVDSNNKMKVDDALLASYHKIGMIGALEDNWNDNGAKAFDPEMIVLAERAVAGLKYQPEIFPLTSGGMQLEYDRADGARLIVSISLNSEWDVYLRRPDKTKARSMMKNDIKALDNLVSAFYDGDERL